MSQQRLPWMSQTEESPVRALLCVSGQRDAAVGQLCWHGRANKYLQQRDELTVNIRDVSYEVVG